MVELGLLLYLIVNFHVFLLLLLLLAVTSKCGCDENMLSLAWQFWWMVGLCLQPHCSHGMSRYSRWFSSFLSPRISNLLYWFVFVSDYFCCLAVMSKITVKFRYNHNVFLALLKRFIICLYKHKTTRSRKNDICLFIDFSPCVVLTAVMTEIFLSKLLINGIQMTRAIRDPWII